MAGTEADDSDLDTITSFKFPADLLHYYRPAVPHCVCLPNYSTQPKVIYQEEEEDSDEEKGWDLNLIIFYVMQDLISPIKFCINMVSHYHATPVDASNLEALAQ